MSGTNELRPKDMWLAPCSVDRPRRSLPIITSTVINDSGELLAPPCDCAADCWQRRAFSKPNSPCRSPSPTVLNGESISPAALARLLRTPSPQRLSRDGTQPRHGSFHAIDPNDDDGSAGEEDTFAAVLSNHSMTHGSCSDKRKIKVRLNNRPPTPPALCTEIAAISQHMAQIGIRDRLHIPNRHMHDVNEAN